MVDWAEKQLRVQEIIADHMSTVRPPSREAMRRATILVQALANAGYDIVPLGKNRALAE